MNVQQLKELGFFFEPVPSNLTRVGHAEPFRYFRSMVTTPADAIRDATIAQSHHDGKGFAFLTTNSWQQMPEFPFVFIMEVDYQKFRALLGQVEAAQEAVKSARDRLFAARAKLEDELSNLL